LLSCIFHRSLLLILQRDTLSFVQRNNLVPVDIVLDICDLCELLKEGFATQRGPCSVCGNGIMLLCTTENIIKIEFV
jgi:hypothetical protein